MNKLKKYKVPFALTFGLMGVLFMFQNGILTLPRVIPAVPMKPVPAPAPVTISNPYHLPLATQQKVELSGNGGPTPSYSLQLSASRTLNVKVSPLAAPHLTVPGYTSWVFPYGCYQVTVVVNGTPQTTSWLRVDGVTQSSSSVCVNAPTEQVLDFSSVLTGNGPINILVTNPIYDNCRYQDPLIYGCQMIPVFTTHMTAAEMTFQVDGTWMDPVTTSPSMTPAPAPALPPATKQLIPAPPVKAPALKSPVD